MFLPKMTFFFFVNEHFVVVLIGRVDNEMLLMRVLTKYMSRDMISNNVVCATSKASDQPAHMRSLIRAFASSLHIL